MIEPARGPALPPAELDTPTDPRAAALIHYWYVCRRSHPAPCRADFSPFKLRPWLGWISIYRLVDGGRDFRVALDGTEVVAASGEDWTGRQLSEIDRTYGAGFCGELAAVLSGSLPTVRRVALVQKSWLAATRVCLPVAHAAARPADQVFLAMFVD